MRSIGMFGQVRPLVIDEKYETVTDFVRNNWNNISGYNSPFKAYGGILIPYDVDDNGDAVYKFNKEMCKENAEKS